MVLHNSYLASSTRIFGVARGWWHLDSATKKDRLAARLDQASAHHANLTLHPLLQLLMQLTDYPDSPILARHERDWRSFPSWLPLALIVGIVSGNSSMHHTCFVWRLSLTRATLPFSSPIQPWCARLIARAWTFARI